MIFYLFIISHTICSILISDLAQITSSTTKQTQFLPVGRRGLSSCSDSFPVSPMIKSNLRIRPVPENPALSPNPTFASPPYPRVLYAPGGQDWCQDGEQKSAFFLPRDLGGSLCLFNLVVMHFQTCFGVNEELISHDQNRKQTCGGWLCSQM